MTFARPSLRGGHESLAGRCEAAVGRLFTAYFRGNRSSRGILCGLAVSVQSCSVGKNGIAFSGFLSSRIAQRQLNSGQVLSQLGWDPSPQETQKTFPLLVQALVRCDSPQDPQVSLSARHSLTKCPHFLHFIHWTGSSFCFVGQTLALQMFKPSLIRRLAESTSYRVSIANACV